MSRFAIVQIVEAEDPEGVWRKLADNEVEHVSDPWSVPHSDGDPLYSVTSLRVTIDGEPVELWPT